jgi:hypothetical protein
MGMLERCRCVLRLLSLLLAAALLTTSMFIRAACSADAAVEDELHAALR